MESEVQLDFNSTAYDEEEDHGEDEELFVRHRP